jgi:hypothetical protein
MKMRCPSALDADTGAATAGRLISAAKVSSSGGETIMQNAAGVLGVTLAPPPANLLPTRRQPQVTEALEGCGGQSPLGKWRSAAAGTGRRIGPPATIAEGLHSPVGARRKQAECFWHRDQARRLLPGGDGGFLPQILQPCPQRQGEGQTAQHSRDHGRSPQHGVGRVSGSQSVQQVGHEAGGNLCSHGC